MKSFRKPFKPTRDTYRVVYPIPPENQNQLPYGAATRSQIVHKMMSKFPKD